MKSCLLITTTLLALPLVRVTAENTIPEPDTLIYGKVVEQGAGQPRQLHEGELRWIVERPDGSLIELGASLE